jgi:RHS repeat-associated protein
MSRAYIFGAGTNDNGNVQNIVNCRDGNRTQNFLYDSLNRIQQAYTTGTNWGETFSPTASAPGVAPTISGIDPWGNLTNRSGVTGKTTYESLSVVALSNNQLSGFSYDAAGNMTQNGSAIYTYDAENRLTTTAGVTYTYDGDGQRVKKSNGTLYWGGTSSDALAETDLSGTLLAEYIFFDGKRVARREASSDVRYYFSDHLGSASVVTYSTGGIRSESDYYPYGGEIVITSGDTNHYKFTGKERDSESGLDEFGARYYGPSLGRFMTPDWAEKPIDVPYADFGNPQSLNLYGYVKNNPTTTRDSDGHETEATLDKEQVESVRQDIQTATTALKGFADAHPVLTNLVINVGIIIVTRGDGEGGGEVGSVPKPSEGEAGTTPSAPSMRAAQREAMRQEGIPTSQQPSAQQNTAAGRQYTYETPKPGGGTEPRVVQRNIGTDSSHPGQPHVEAGSPKSGGQKDSIGRPRLDSNKTKINVKRPNGD